MGSEMCIRDSNEYHDGILEIANSLLKILTNQIGDKTMVAAVKGEWEELLSSISSESFGRIL